MNEPDTSPPQQQVPAEPISTDSISPLGTTQQSVQRSPVQNPTTPMTTLTPQPSTVEIPQFPRVYNLLLLGPIVGYLLSVVSSSSQVSSSELFMLYCLMPIIGLSIVFLYVMQWRYIRKYITPNNLTIDLVFMLLGLAVPLIAAAIGDAAGLSNFGSDSGSGGGVWMGALTGGVVASIILFFTCISNLWLINARQITSVHKVLGVIAKIITVISLLIIAYFCYIIAYSLRNPSTE